MSPAAGEATVPGATVKLPAVVPAAHVVDGVAWSPKLVKVNGRRPDGAVRKAALSGSTPSCMAL